MTVQEWQAEMTERTAEAMAYWMGATTEDRLSWTPKAEGGTAARSVSDMTQECIRANRRFSALLRGQEINPSTELMPLSQQEMREELIESARELAEIIRTLPDEALDRIYQMKRGPMSGALLIQRPAQHMQYHSGQINYIQTLYGDTQFQYPPSPQP